MMIASRGLVPDSLRATGRGARVAAGAGAGGGTTVGGAETAGGAEGGGVATAVCCRACSGGNNHRIPATVMHPNPTSRSNRKAGDRLRRREFRREGTLLVYSPPAAKNNPW